MALQNADLLIDEADQNRYCVSLNRYARYPSREVNVGRLPLGGDNPIRLQSMTTTDTMDTAATVAQTIRMIETGCEYVRITAPSQNEARNLGCIKEELRKRGYEPPLIADIHYTPKAAEIAARIVEKVRVNPGNYADKKKFQIVSYTDAQYQEELDRIRAKFSPLVRVCKEYGTAMRIGTNHGSLSDRIMSRYGDTPLGMVESALEFARICEDLGYRDIVFSMKASNPKVMVQAYRLLVHKMAAEGRNYPLHLGVTEAGEGEDGRIKSAVGIGTLLEDGIGDTVRVSLTEEPEAEIPVARLLVERYSRRAGHAEIPDAPSSPIDPFDYRRRPSLRVQTLGADCVPVVLAALPHPISPDTLEEIGYRYQVELDKWHIADQAADFLYLGGRDLDFPLPGGLKKILDYKAWSNAGGVSDSFPIYRSAEYIRAETHSNVLNFVRAFTAELTPESIRRFSEDRTVVLVLETVNAHAMPDLRRAFYEVLKAGAAFPVIIRRRYEALDGDTLRLHASTDFGALLTDGLGDGIWLDAPGHPPEAVLRTAFGILQATRTRISKTEYISCPSCGRTLFDLQETTAEIRSRTDHLKGVKIGIMGCIVNGPGEMADADYGYVGSGPGQITLYRGKEIVKRAVPTASAVNELIGLMQEDGRWFDPET